VQGGVGSPSNTVSPGPRPTPVPSGMLIHPAVWPQQTWAEIRGCAPSGGRELGPDLTQCGQGKAYHYTKWHLDPSSRLATTDMSRKLGALPPFWAGRGAESPCNTMWHGPRLTSVPSGILIHPAIWREYMGRKSRGAAEPPFWGGGAGSPSNTMSPGPMPTSVPSSILSIQPFGHNTWAENWGGGAVPPLCGGGAGSPSNTMSSRPRPTPVPSGILIHPAVWPQETWAKLGGCALFQGGWLGPHLTQCGRGRGVPSWQVSS